MEKSHPQRRYIPAPKRISITPPYRNGPSGTGCRTGYPEMSAHGTLTVTVPGTRIVNISVLNSTTGTPDPTCPRCAPAAPGGCSEERSVAIGRTLQAVVGRFGWIGRSFLL